MKHKKNQNFGFESNKNQKTALLRPVHETPNSIYKFTGFLSNKTNKALTIDEINDSTQKGWSKS